MHAIVALIPVLLIVALIFTIQNKHNSGNRCRKQPTLNKFFTSNTNDAPSSSEGPLIWKKESIHKRTLRKGQRRKKRKVTIATEGTATVAPSPSRFSNSYQACKTIIGCAAWA